MAWWTSLLRWFRKTPVTESSLSDDIAATRLELQDLMASLTRFDANLQAYRRESGKENP